MIIQAKMIPIALSLSKARRYDRRQNKKQGEKRKAS
jgi:hypothetical protein